MLGVLTTILLIFVAIFVIRPIVCVIFELSLWTIATALWVSLGIFGLWMFVMVILADLSDR